MDHHVLQLPRLGHVARHALPHLLESTIIPVVIFYASLRVWGLGTAVIATMIWAYAAVTLRIVRRRPVPGMLLLGIITLTARSVLALATGSGFLYFLSPALTPVLVAGAFMFSVLLRRPLAERLARDLVPLPESLLATSWMRIFFTRITLLWAAVFVVNGMVSLWLLVSSEVGAYVVSRTAVSIGLTVAAVAASTLVFLTMARRHHTRLVRA